MTNKKVWFITGAGRGMGVDIAKTALAAGHAVVATARNTDAVTAALGQDENLLAVPLDVTDPAHAEAAVKPTVDRFGRLDVLVNNAGNSPGGWARNAESAGLASASAMVVLCARDPAVRDDRPASYRDAIDERYGTRGQRR